MKKILYVFVLLWASSSFFFSFNLGALPASSEKDLDKTLETLNPFHQNWFNMVTSIASKEEKRVFKSLSNDKDREAFISMFWMQRDPTPGTPQNEYKTEIESRFAYVNRYLRVGAGKPGWMTERGKIYMILGKPSSIESFEDKAGLYPTLVWYYYGDKSLGLPTYFNITFYRPFGAGDWKLYNPAVEGPYTLLIPTKQISAEDYIKIYNEIKELAPTLVGPAFSMMPGETQPGIRPSTRNLMVMAQIIDSPTKKINTTYATNFLNYKGFVNLESSINFIENSCILSLTRNENSGYTFVNLSIKPKKISVGYNKERDQYFFNFKLVASLKQKENIIYQYTKNFEFYLTPDEVNAYQGRGLVIHDSFPIIPGTFVLSLFVENAVGREFSYVDREIQVSAADSIPFLATPILAYRSEPKNDNLIYTYKYVGEKMVVDSERIFGLNEIPSILVGMYNLTPEMWEKGKAVISLKGLNERNKFFRQTVLALSDLPKQKNVNTIKPLSENRLPPDYYEVTVQLIDPANVVLDTKQTEFTVSPLEKIAHPIETFKQSLADNPYYFDYILALQYESTGNLERAENLFLQAVARNPQFVDGQIALLNCQLRLKKYQNVLENVETLKDNEKKAFDYHLLKGSAFYYLARYEEGLSQLLKANEIYNSDTRVLNLIGFTLLKQNEYAEALKALEASLRLNAKQPQIEKIVSDLKKKFTESNKTENPK